MEKLHELTKSKNNAVLNRFDCINDDRCYVVSDDGHSSSDSDGANRWQCFNGICS